MSLESAITTLTTATQAQLDQVTTLIGTINGKADSIDTAVASAVAAVPQWDRTFYVDTAGDDSADGSAGAPLATLKEALTRVAKGGTATIYLTTDQTFSVTDNLDIQDRAIRLRGYGAGTAPIIAIGSTATATHNSLKYLVVNAGSSIEMSNVDVSLAGKADGGLPWSSANGWINHAFTRGGLSSVRLDTVTISSSDAEVGLINGHVGAVVACGVHVLTLDTCHLIVDAETATVSLGAYGITLSNGATLLDAAPITRADGVTNVTTNYAGATGLNP